MTRRQKNEMCREIFGLHGYCRRRYDKKQMRFIHIGPCLVSDRKGKKRMPDIGRIS